MSDKRKDYISWDGYFMGIAFLSALRSKDPSTRNGSCIVDNKNRIIGTGYNGFPMGLDGVFPWARSAEEKDQTKFPYVIHSEINCILNSSTKNLEGCRLYLFSEKGYYPCCECMKVIMQSGINEIILESAIVANTDQYDWKATLKMIDIAKIKLRVLDFDVVKRDFGIIGEEIRLLESRKKNS